VGQKSQKEGFLVDGERDMGRGEMKRQGGSHCGELEKEEGLEILKKLLRRKKKKSREFRVWGTSGGQIT